MTRPERIEGIIIVAAATASWLLASLFPPTRPVWQIVLNLSVLLLAQSLVRDVSILFRHRRSPSAENQKIAQCMCLESTVGATGILAAAVLVGLGSSRKVTIQRWEFSLAIAATLLLGLAIKDLVITWNPLGVRQEKDHLNLIVGWKRKAN